MGCNLSAADPDDIEAAFDEWRTGSCLERSICSMQDPGKSFVECHAVLTEIEKRTEMPKVKPEKGCSKDADGRLLPMAHWLHDHPGTRKPILRIEFEKENSGYIELRYQARAYPISKNKCPEPGQAKLDLDEDIADEQMFRVAYEYLTGGSWSPSPPSATSGFDYSCLPKIASTVPSETPYFLTQLRAYRVAIMLNLPKMKELALQRLEKSGRILCVEDPIVLFEMLYHGTTTLGAKELPIEVASSGKKDKGGGKGGSTSSFSSSPPPPPPDRDLRTWARSFLKAPTGDKKMPTNIDALRQGEQYRYRWVQLRVKGNALLEDADRCEAELMEEGEKKVKKKEQEAKADEKEATLRAMTNVLQGMGPHAMNSGIMIHAMQPRQVMAGVGAQVVPHIGQVQPQLQILPGIGPVVIQGQNQTQEQEVEQNERDSLKRKLNFLRLREQIHEQSVRDKEAIEEATKRLQDAQGVAPFVTGSMWPNPWGPPHI